MPIPDVGVKVVSYTPVDEYRLSTPPEVPTKTFPSLCNATEYPVLPGFDAATFVLNVVSGEPVEDNL